MVISSDSFSSEELRALEAIAKSFQLKVYWTKSVRFVQAFEYI